jgi:programmed cell death 6-interacting protein
VTGKGFAFGALAQFHAAEVAGDDQSYGEQIARLKEARRLMDQSTSYIPNAFPEQVALINKAEERATKDNNFIYHARVPDFKTLPLLNKAALAKPSAIIHPLSPRFKDLFESLVPVSVQHALSTFETRKNEVVNVDVARMREYTQLMNA